jgi:hypothetical protein
MKIEGKIKSVKTSYEKKKDLEYETGTIHIKSDFETISINGDKTIIAGYNPEDDVTITITRSQKTLGESIGNDNEKSIHDNSEE